MWCLESRLLSAWDFSMRRIVGLEEAGIRNNHKAVEIPFLTKKRGVW